MQSFDRSPQILLDIFADDFTIVVDKVGDIEEAFTGIGLLAFGDACLVHSGVFVYFDNRSWNYADLAFFGQRAILFEIVSPISTCVTKLGIVR